MSEIDKQKTLEIIERMQLAKIGEYKKWESLIKKLNKEQELNPEEIEYISSLARIYKEKVTPRSKLYHVRLSENDKKPKCNMCSENSEFYCNMNDAYYCPTHVIGHDENEI